MLCAMTTMPSQERLEYDMGPERTSIMAIMALVLSILGCIPGVGVVGALLGLLALVAIGSSAGRVGGRGLAIAAIIIGLLLSMVSAACVYGGYQMAQVAGQQFRSGTALARAIHDGDYNTARQKFSPAVQASVTDDLLKQFSDGVTAEAGAFKRGPEGLWETVEMFSTLKSSSQQMNSRSMNNAMPVPLEYEKGTVIFVMDFDTKTQPGPGMDLKIFNLHALLPSGNQVDVLPSPVKITVPSPPAAPGALPPGEPKEPDAATPAESAEPVKPDAAGKN